MAETGIMAEIYSSPFPIEKIGDSPYPVNAGIPRQNGDRFGQYPRGQVYLPSLYICHLFYILFLNQNIPTKLDNFYKLHRAYLFVCIGYVYTNSYKHNKYMVINE